MRSWIGVSGLAFGLALTGCAAPAARTAAAPPAPPPMYFHPQRDQTAERQDRDRYEYYRWAVRQTGTDPGMQAIARSAEPAAVPGDPGTVAAGAVAGAAVGTLAASPRDAVGGLVLGAVFGGLMGAAADASRVHAAEEDAAAAHARETAAQQAVEREFHRAMAACMSGRGYDIR